jgi:predicted ester cyclase
VSEANKTVVRRLVHLLGHPLGGEWFGQASTGRRFELVDEVWIVRFRDGRIVHVWSVEDTLGRLRQLGLTDLHG